MPVFKTIFLEVNRHGYAEYDSDIIPIQEPFTQFDPAQLVLDQAKIRGLEVHAYFHTLSNTRLVAEHPEWAMERVDYEAKKIIVNGEFSKRIDRINSSRTSSQLIMYTPEHGETTRTNMYGAEAIVKEGVVVEIVDYVGDAPIPENDFVLSGTGSGKSSVVFDTLATESRRKMTFLQRISKKGNSRADNTAENTNDSHATDKQIT